MLTKLTVEELRHLSQAADVSSACPPHGQGHAAGLGARTIQHPALCSANIPWSEDLHGFSLLGQAFPASYPLPKQILLF